jgi:hypothetical protein
VAEIQNLQAAAEQLQLLVDSVPLYSVERADPGMRSLHLRGVGVQRHSPELEHLAHIQLPVLQPVEPLELLVKEGQGAVQPHQAHSDLVQLAVLLAVLPAAAVVPALQDSAVVLDVVAVAGAAAAAAAAADAFAAAVAVVDTSSAAAAAAAAAAAVESYHQHAAAASLLDVAAYLLCVG